jgi:undecaprenyl-diphosphatase
MIEIRKRAAEAWQMARKLDHTEWIPLAVLFVAALAAWLFVELADEVVEGDLYEFDRGLLLVLRNPQDITDPLGPAWLEDLMRDLTALGSPAVLAAITLAACGYLWLQGKHLAVMYVLVAVLGALALSTTLKAAFNRPRPDLVEHGQYVYTASFPSGHSMMATATFLTLGGLLARYQPQRRLRVYLVVVASLLSLAVGVSRVYLSVHWPTDVLAGWAIGSAWALLCFAAASFLESRGKIEVSAAGSE